ncbi:uncharacterized protein LOC143990040 [Lithobates pipiens]
MECKPDERTSQEREEWLKMEEDEWVLKEQAGEVEFKAMKETNIKCMEFQPCELEDLKIQWHYEVADEEEVKQTHVWHVKNIWEPAKQRKKTKVNQTEEEEKDNSEEAEQKEEEKDNSEEAEQKEEEKDNSEEAEQKEEEKDNSEEAEQKEEEKDNSEEAEQKEEEKDNSEEAEQTCCQCHCIHPCALLGCFVGPLWRFMKKHPCSCFCGGRCEDKQEDLFWFKLTREERARRLRRAKERDITAFREEWAKIIKDREKGEEERMREKRVTEEEKKREQRVRTKRERERQMPTEERRREIRIREEEKVREERVRAKRAREQRAKEDRA